MKSTYKLIFFAAAILSLSVLPAIRGDCADKTSIQGADWHLVISSFEDGLGKIPVIGGLASISAENGQEGVIIQATIKPRSGNNLLVIELRDFRLVVGNEEFSPVTADLRPKGKNTVESIQWPNGHSSTLNKDDFPAQISIMYLVTKNSQKILSIKGGNPTPLLLSK
jgi:hypothetical protein